MQASKYNFVTTFPETQEKLLFNTRMTAFVALFPDAFRQVNAVLTEPMAKHDPSLVSYEGVVNSYNMTYYLQEG